MITLRKLATGAAFIALSITTAFAQAPAAQPKAAAPAAPAASAPAPTAPAVAKAVKPAKAAKGPKKERTAESIACSGKADEAGLKGKAKSKERRAFRKKCEKDMVAAGAPAAAPKAPAVAAPAAASKAPAAAAPAAPGAVAPAKKP